MLYEAPKLDEEGYYTTQLWSLFKDFGEYCYLGSNLPIEDIKFEPN